VDRSTCALCGVYLATSGTRNDFEMALEILTTLIINVLDFGCAVERKAKKIDHYLLMLVFVGSEN
jgi:hypothetical protein